MKKLLLIGIGIGILNFAHANSITLVNGGTITGDDAYLFLITEASLGLTSGQTISDVNLVFTDITLTSTDAKDTVSADVIDEHAATHTYTDNDDSGDYFASHGFSPLTNLGTKNFTAPIPIYGTGSKKHTIIGYTYDTESWSYDVSSADSNLNADLLAGGFDIGIDPDCIYDVGSITLTYTVNTPPPPSVPDTATTAGLLGMSVMGLLFFRHKLAFN